MMTVELNGKTHDPEPTGTLDGEAPESTDWANYFVTYAYLYHQKDMIEDHRRTGAYYQAVQQNKQQFEGKVVLDVGTGSGILAIFAAKAGARKVYAVEATPMAVKARTLVKGNNLSHIVEVIQGTIETVVIPEKVDIIISEWMGFFLLRESMLDSVLIARDRWLKPGGALYPSQARMYFAPIRSTSIANGEHEFQGDSSVDLRRTRWGRMQSAMEGWDLFVGDVKRYYGVDMDCLTDNFREEQRSYYLATSSWSDVHPSQLLSSPTCFQTYDLASLELEKVLNPIEVDIQMEVLDAGPVHAFVGFFDVAFRGSKENPANMEVLLTTAPDPAGPTHWGQQTFPLHPALTVAAHSLISGRLSIRRRPDNNRLLQFCLVFHVTCNGQLTHQERTCTWQMD
eukprot:jgi/Botrbrau1/12522/Bobra.0169s0064.1